MTVIGVRSFGTENRRGGINEIQATEQEIAEVLFKVDHIKDFKILEKPNTTLLDPAIISTSYDTISIAKDTSKDAPEYHTKSMPASA